MKPNILIFDVESTSLHGKGFAVAAVVADKVTGVIVDTLQLMCAEGEVEAMANQWVKDNVLPHLKDMPMCASYEELRTTFYNFYMKHRETCDVWSDVNFPVETNFLSAIVADDVEGRQWNMPYPLYDVSTIVDISIDRIAEINTADCATAKAIKHHPMSDSFASLYCLLKALNERK